MRVSWYALFGLLTALGPAPGLVRAATVILDNGAPGTSSAGGTWRISTGDNPYGADSLYSSRAGATYTYSVSLPQAGSYEVYLWWTRLSNRRPDVPVDITHAGGTTRVTVNQLQNGGKWNLVGAWTFGTGPAGPVATITIHSLGEDTTCADAVRLDLVSGSTNQPPAAVIDAIAPSPALPGQSVSFSGHGVDADGSIAAWRWRSSRDGDLSTAASFSTAALSTGTHTISFAVQDDGGAWSSEAQASLTVGVPAPAAEVVIDDGDPGTSSTGGTWRASGGANPHGGDSLYSSRAGATYTFDPLLPQPGTYRVYLWWTRVSNRRPDVPVEVKHALGATTVTVNQLANGGQWNLIGSWSFTSKASIAIRSLGDGTTCADAARLVFEGGSGGDEEPSGIDSRPPNPGCILLDRPGSGSTGLALARAFPGLAIDAVALLQAPGDRSRWFIIERRGRVLTFPNLDSAASASTFLDIQGRVQMVTDIGFLGMAFHPDFAANGHAYVFYTRAGYSPRSNFISRFTSNDGGATLNPNSEVVLIRSPQPSQIHAGGHMAFGPDGYLYIGLGEVGREEYTQDLNILPGKMLRIDVDHGSPYAIPPDNPFASGGGLPEIWAWGLRNPWGWSFDRATGEIWAGDVGATKWEEVDKIEAGHNYGWPIRQGAHCKGTTTCDTTGLTDPIVEYSHSEGNAIIGGYVYRGSALPAFTGVYLYADYGSGKIWGLYHDGLGRPTPQLLLDSGVTIISFAEDIDGELYIVAGGSMLYRLVPGSGGEPDTFPQRLSDLACVDPADPSRPGPSLIPYDINVPFWSDNAQKSRWFALPDGETIHIASDGEWEFPIGSLFLKTFRLNNRLIETRLLVRHGDGEWAGYSYEWNDAQTDAVLLPDEKTKSVEGQDWTYPSRAQCLACHTGAAERVLGLDTAQMNRSFTYAATGRTANQLATFQHIGLFDAPLPGPTADLAKLPSPGDGSVPINLRARSYLHANCSHCHRPNGGGGGPLDFRYATADAAVGACDVAPGDGDLGVPGALLIYPGDPARSIVSLRMHVTDSNRMPPIARNIVDGAGTALIDAWIAATTTCP